MIRPAAAILLVVLLAPPVRGADLALSAGAEVQYDTNAFRQPEADDDVFLRLRPRVRLQETRGQDLNFSIDYELPLRFALRFHELDDIDHLVNASFRYHASDRMTFTGSESYQYLRGNLPRNFDEQSVIAGQGTPGVNQGRSRVRTNNAALGLSYLFSPRWVGSVQAQHYFYESDREGVAAVQALTGTGSITYAVNRRHRLGVGAQVNQQEFEETVSFPSSRSRSATVFGSWDYTIDPTTTFRIALGPTLLEQDQDRAAVIGLQSQVPFEDLGSALRVQDPNSCQTVEGQTVAPCSFFSLLVTDPTQIDAIRNARIAVVNVDPAGGNSSRWTVFGNVQLTKRWTPHLSSALRYDRRQGIAQGVGGTVITDAASVSAQWTPWERWNFALRGDWTRRETATSQRSTFFIVCPTDINNLAAGCSPGGSIAGLSGVAFNSDVSNSRVETTRWGVSGQAGYRLFRNTRFYLRVTYDQQESRRGTRGAGSDFDDFVATLGLQYAFEPRKLW